MFNTLVYRNSLVRQNYDGGSSVARVGESGGMRRRGAGLGSALAYC